MAVASLFWCLSYLIYISRTIATSQIISNEELACSAIAYAFPRLQTLTGTHLLYVPYLPHYLMTTLIQYRCSYYLCAFVNISTLRRQDRVEHIATCMDRLETAWRSYWGRVHTSRSLHYSAKLLLQPGSDVRQYTWDIELCKCLINWSWRFRSLRITSVWDWVLKRNEEFFNGIKLHLG